MKNSNRSELKTSSIGVIAAEVVSTNQNAQVYGKTSKGIFLKTPGKWIIFLSFERFKGPLTITLEEFDPMLQRISLGNPVQITPGSIFLEEQEIVITFEGSPTWQPPPPGLPVLRSAERQEKLLYLAGEALSKKNGVGISGFLPALLGLPEEQPSRSSIHGLRRADIEGLQTSLRNGEVDSLTRRLYSILGAGPGLTPSADDFSVGLLLTLNRWRILPWKSINLRELNRKVVNAAYEKTTTLSANLIECATLGLANERLVNALDWVVTGEAREPEIIRHLLEWGNSSGVDTFAGMAVALNALLF
jgi:hypothetical protein